MEKKKAQTTSVHKRSLDEQNSRVILILNETMIHLPLDKMGNFQLLLTAFKGNKDESSSRNYSLCYLDFTHFLGDSSSTRIVKAHLPFT